MSLVGLALRMCAVRALEESGIFPTGRVFDSMFHTVDEVAGADPKPFAIVSTETITSSPSGRDLNTGDRIVELWIELALTHPAVDGSDIQIPETDAGLEAALAILERQVFTCLFGFGGGAWGDAFRGLAASVSEVISRRGVSAKEGARFAARQFVLMMQPIAEPPFAMAVEAGTPFANFLAQAEEDEGTRPIAQLIRQAVEDKPADWPEVYTVTAALAGYTEADARAIGLALDEPDANPPAISAIIAKDGAGASLSIDEATAAENLPEDE